MKTILSRWAIIIPFVVFIGLVLQGLIFDFTARELVKMVISCLYLSAFCFICVKIKTGNRTKLILFIFLSVLFIEVAVRLLEGWYDSVGSIPRLIVELATIGLFPLLSGKLYKRLIWVIASTCTISMCYYAYPLFRDYSYYRVWNSNRNEPMPPNVFFYSQNIHKATLLPEDKIVFCDFWHKRCSVCYEKFPTVQRLYNDIGQNNRGQIITVGVLVDSTDTWEDLQSVMHKHGYNLPVVACQPYVAELMKIYSYPTALIIKDDRIVYRGNTEGAVDFYQRLINESRLPAARY